MAMDWIKIKTQHMLFSELSMAERGMLVSIQSLAAHLERFPTEKEIAMLPGMGRKALATLSDKLRNTDATLSDIVRKVLEDVADVKHKRGGDRDRKRMSRSKNQNVTRDIGVTSQHAVTPCHAPREDKIREEKIIIKEAASGSEKKTAAAAFFENRKALKPKAPIPEQTAEPTRHSYQPVPKSVEETIRQVVAERRALGKVHNIAGLEAALRNAWRNNPGELESWQQELAENAANAETRALAQRTEQERAEKLRKDEEEMAKTESLRRGVLKRFEALPIDERNDVLMQAKVLAGVENGPDAPVFLFNEIAEVMG